MDLEDLLGGVVELDLVVVRGLSGPLGVSGGQVKTAGG